MKWELIEKIPEMILLGLIFGVWILIFINIYFFIVVFSIFIIKIAILINLKNKYSE